MRILILEDNRSDVALMLSALAALRPFTHGVARSEYDFLNALDQDWDIILSDYNLPQFNALSALNILAERRLSIPLIVVTGALGREAEATCMRLGAVAFVLKEHLDSLAGLIARTVQA